MFYKNVSTFNDENFKSRKIHDHGPRVTDAGVRRIRRVYYIVYRILVFGVLDVEYRLHKQSMVLAVLQYKLSTKENILNSNYLAG